MDALKNKRCKPCEGGVAPIPLHSAKELVAQIPGWELDADGKAIYRAFTFKDFAQAILFVNALAWMAEQEGHHPDLEVGYGRCTVRFNTHSIGGLSENDFICAAKVNALLDEPGIEKVACKVGG